LRIALGSDHAGYKLKEEIGEMLRSEHREFKDFGAYSDACVDYPDAAHEVARGIVSGEFDCGILVCGTGVGMSMAANKVPGIRAALCSNEYSARLSREHNDANVLTLGGRTIGPELAKEIVRIWLEAKFDPQSRHRRRVAKLERKMSGGQG